MSDYAIHYDGKKVRLPVDYFKEQANKILNSPQEADEEGKKFFIEQDNYNPLPNPDRPDSEGGLEENVSGA